MSINQEFTITKGFISYKQLKEIKYPIVALGDDLYQLMAFSFAWIPTEWDLGQRIKKNQGFNYYGISLLYKEGITLFQQILNTWKQLFLFAPKVVKFSGAFILEEDGKTVNEYEKVILSKQRLLNTLNQLLDLCNTALKEEKCIIQFGI